MNRRVSRAAEPPLPLIFWKNSQLRPPMVAKIIKNLSRQRKPKTLILIDFCGLKLIKIKRNLSLKLKTNF
jgi:hypothetical protein